MRIRDIISLGSQYLKLGIVIVILIMAIFLCYYLVSKRKNDGRKKLGITKLALYAVFLCYMVVVLGATMLSRGGSWQRNVIQPLFYSYREAWNNFSIIEWRNIILNILMFVPFGFLLPLLSKRFAAFWKTYLTGFAFTLFIEVMQLILRRGIFEFDDILNNTLGAMIGYGCYRVVLFVVLLIKKEKAKIVPVLCYQLPACFTVAVFIIIFSVYSNQELGNLRSNYIRKVNNVEVKTDISLSSEETETIVFQSYIANESETRQMAEEMFERFGLGIDESRIDIYEDEAVYYSDGGNRINMWIRYVGKTFRYTDFDVTFGENMKEKADAGEEEIRTALKKLGVEPPKGAVLEYSDEQGYIFTANKIIDGGKMYNGTVRFSYTEDGIISDLYYNIIELQEYKKFSVISEQDAYKKLEQGKFLCRPNDEYTISVLKVNLEYEMDTKGYYQPIYVFEVMLNGEKDDIIIPAIK